MIRCNNCNRIFENEDFLTTVLEVQQRTPEDGKFHTVERYPVNNSYVPVQEENCHEELFKGCGSCCSDEFLMDVDKDCNFTDAEIEQIWDIFEDVPLDVEYLNTDWFGFKKGTKKEEIWRWFDEKHSMGVRYLLDEKHSMGVRCLLYERIL